MFKSFFFLILFVFVFGCNQTKISNQNDSVTNKIDSVNNKMGLNSGKRILGLDRKINTEFIDQNSTIKLNDSLSVFKGIINKVGNEPFIRFSLFVSDSVVLGLSGDNAFMEFTERNQSSEIRVVGKKYQILDQQWLKVYFVFNK